MIFTELVIDNFGVFKGENCFDLRPRTEEGEGQPIVLFGGKNGSGKTTILEAIRLCLYGRNALGNRVRRKDYGSYIIQRMHHSKLEQAHTARVRLIFEHTHAGTRSVYDAVRAWTYEGDRFAEDVSIYKDGHILNEIPRDYWDDFLRDLIPPGVANLFFFDGEQIQALASDQTEAETLSEAIRGLLNLDLVERLRSDLNIYLKRQKTSDQSLLERDVTEALNRIEQVREEILKEREKRAHHRSKLDHAQKNVQEARQNLLEEGGNFLLERDRFVERSRLLEQQIREVKGDIRELSADLLPFALVPRWSQKLQKRLEQEKTVKQANAAFDILQDKYLEIKDLLNDPQFRDDLGDDVSQLSWDKLTLAILERIRPFETHDETIIRHRISDKTRNELLGWISQSQQEVPQYLQKLSNRLEKLEKERAQVEDNLHQVPAESVAMPLIGEFQEWSQEVGSLETAIDNFDLQIQSLKSQLSELEKHLFRLEQELSKAKGVEKRIRRAAQAQVILHKYNRRITKQKVNELEATFIDYFQRLARKKELVKAIKVNPKTFETTLYKHDGDAISKMELSAGEKQLYAMALLWALRSVSGRVLPIIMDTPMGRLDRDHRRAILENFLPYAAHQMIVLSTDSEIDAEAYEQVEESVSHAVRLEYDEAAGFTRVSEGYFGRAPMGAVL